MPIHLKATLALVVLGWSISSQAASIAGHWEGEIEIPNQPLVVKIDLRQDGDDWHGAIDIPAQGASALPLDVAKVEQDAVEFSIRGVPGNPAFAGREANGVIRGVFSQGAAKLDFQLTRDEVPGPRRPQEPKPPFAYGIEEVLIDAGAVQLAGTLTVPAGDPPFPVVFLISGSGLQDRDQTLFAHKPFWVIAGHLTRSGVAVLRVDDAGFGASTPHPEPPTTVDFAGDAAASVEFLRNDDRFDQVGLVGHSEGGLIAALLASVRDDIDFIVLLAAPGVPGTELMRGQNLRIFEAAGLADERATALLELLDQLFAVLVSDLPEAEVRERVEAIVRAQMAVNGVTAVQQNDAQVKAAVERALSPRMLNFLRLDPRPPLEATKVPVLALNGGLDMQVDAETNLSGIASALAKGGNANVAIHRLSGLNHLFQRAETGLVDEYASIEETISPEVLNLIRDWILSVVP